MICAPAGVCGLKYIAVTTYLFYVWLVSLNVVYIISTFNCNYVYLCFRGVGWGAGGRLFVLY